MAINIIKNGDDLILRYSPQNGTSWIYDEYFNGDLIYDFRGIFQLSADLLYSEPPFYENNDTFINFRIGTLDGNYYVIPANIIQTQYDVLIHQSANITNKYFGISERENILKKMEDIAHSQIIIDEEAENISKNIETIPIAAFEQLLKLFPTSTEKSYYTSSRISQILMEYFENTRDYGKLYDNFIRKKEVRTEISNTLDSVKKYEKEKYNFILSELEKMLQNVEGYTENVWRDKILQFIVLIYPKYILPISELPIKDFTRDNPTNRFADIALVDEGGNIDIIEIKRPYNEKNIISNQTYRDNFIPSRELSGAIMQTEKYLYHLNRMGNNGEVELTKKYEDKLSQYNLSIKITNPKGIIIAGRSNNFSDLQRLDFEIIRRKYANIIDIITYDDLINRLHNLIQKFS